MPLNNVVRHYDASRKVCPYNMSANNWGKWDQFKSKLAGTQNTNDIGIATVTGDVVNTRRGATTSYAIVGTLKKNEKVRVANTYNNWANIYFGNNKVWVCMDYLKIDYFKKEATNTPNKIYRVQVGAFKDRNNAEILLKELKAKGFEGFIKED